MIGTLIITVIGYGLALLFAYEFVAHGIRSIIVDGLRAGKHGKAALGAALLSVAAAAITRGLIGGQF